jgi:hypothetical protein
MAVQGSVNPRPSLDFLIGPESSKLARVSNPLERMELAVPVRGCSGMTTRDREARIDEALKESFPASAPPSFVGAGAPAGSPPVRRKQPGEWGQDYGFAPFSNPKPLIFTGRE